MLFPPSVGTDTEPDQNKKKKQPFILDFDVKSICVAKAINIIVSIAFPSLLDLSVWHSCNQAPSLYTEGERETSYTVHHTVLVYFIRTKQEAEKMMKRLGERSSADANGKRLFLVHTFQNDTGSSHNPRSFVCRRAYSPTHI